MSIEFPVLAQKPGTKKGTFPHVVSLHVKQEADPEDGDQYLGLDVLADEDADESVGHTVRLSKTITIEIPDDLTHPAGASDEDVARDARLALACLLWYDRGMISQARGRRSPD